MMRHFASIERAQPASKPAMQKGCNERGALLTGDACACLNIYNVMPMQELVRSIGKLKAGAAAGLDFIDNEVLEIDPRASARVSHPILARASIGDREPCSFKEGR
eukprot:8515105-Pyramimonas_sp.AAC.1